MQRVPHTVISLLVVVALAGCAAPFGDDGTPTPDQATAEVTPSVEATETPTSDPTNTGERTTTQQEPAPDEQMQTPGEQPAPPENSTPAETERRFEPSAYANLGTDELPGDENQTYDRVTELMGSDTTPPTLTVRSGEDGLDEYFSNRYDFGNDVRLTRLNMTEVTVGDGAAGLTQQGGILIDPGNGSQAEIKAVVAHEFAHHVQRQEGWFIGEEPRGWAGNAPPTGTTEHSLAYRALIEGGAVYVSDRYADRYIDEIESNTSQFDANWQEYTSGPPGNTYIEAPYALGAAYVHETVEDPADLETLYKENPPNSTYEILFPEANTTGAATGLDLAVNTTGDTWRGTSEDRMGALFLHTLITTTHPPETATQVVRGYRGDQMVKLLDRSGEFPLLWGLSFESSRDANQFVTTFRDGLDRRTDSDADEFSLEHLGNGTVLVVAGDDAVQQVVEANVNDRTLDVTVGPPAGETNAAQSASYTDSTVAPVG